MKQQKLPLKSEQVAILSAIAKAPVLLFISNFSAMGQTSSAAGWPGVHSVSISGVLNTQLAKPWETSSDLRACLALSQRPEHRTSWGCSQTKLSYHPMPFMLVSEALGFCFFAANSLDEFILLTSFLPSVQHFTWNYDNWLPIHPVYHLYHY